MLSSSAGDRKVTGVKNRLTSKRRVRMLWERLAFWETASAISRNSWWGVKVIVWKRYGLRKKCSSLPASLADCISFRSRKFAIMEKWSTESFEIKDGARVISRWYPRIPRLLKNELNGSKELVKGRRNSVLPGCKKQWLHVTWKLGALLPRK